MPNLATTVFTWPNEVSSSKDLQRSLQTTPTKGAQLFGALNVDPKVPGFNPGFN